MKIAIIGATGLIGSRLVKELRTAGHDVLAGSPASGVNTVLEKGLRDAMLGADALIDVTNSRSFTKDAIANFFEISTRNLLAAAVDADIQHHLVLSVVGSDRLPESYYLHAKTQQEKLVRASRIPYTILRSTQFFEFLGSIAEAGAFGEEIRLSPALVQPVAASDVVSALAAMAIEKPLNETTEIAGPKSYPLDDIARKLLAAWGDPRRVIPDIHARYFGAKLSDLSLTPGKAAQLGSVKFEEWLLHFSRQNEPAAQGSPTHMRTDASRNPPTRSSDR